MPDLQKVANPSLPLPGKQYDSQYQDQLNNVLRLYFNRLGASFNGLLDPTYGGEALYFPHAAFHSTQTQTVSAANTPTLITFNNTDFASGIRYVAGDGLHFDTAGIFNLAFSIQVTNYDTQAHDVYIWIRYNGSDYPYSASAATVSGTHGGLAGKNVVAANFFGQSAAGGYVELWWAADSTQVKLETLAPTTSPFAMPGSPSVVTTISFVSNAQD